jgi:hypothetical protein
MKTKKNTSPILSSWLVIRYHSAPVQFATLAEAEEFAMNCGDFADLKELTL